MSGESLVLLPLQQKADGQEPVREARYEDRPSCSPATQAHWNAWSPCRTALVLHHLTAAQRSCLPTPPQGGEIQQGLLKGEAAFTTAPVLV